MFKIGFDMQTYQALALGTEAPGTPTKEQMLLKTWEVVGEVFTECQALGENIDRVKRTVYYGKVNGELMDELLPTYPTGERAERIKQCLRFMHGVIGLVTEVGEVCQEALRYVDEGGQLNVDNIKVEMGDLLWYINLIAAFCKTTIPRIAAGNVAKLAARYPEKFNALRVIERDTDKEDQVAKQAETKPTEAHEHALEDLVRFLKIARRFRLTPIVDDDFPGMKFEFDRQLDALFAAYCPSAA